MILHLDQKNENDQSQSTKALCVKGKAHEIPKVIYKNGGEEREKDNNTNIIQDNNTNIIYVKLHTEYLKTGPYRKSLTTKLKKTKEEKELKSDLQKVDERLNHLSEQIKYVTSEKISLLLGYTCGTTTQNGKIRAEGIEDASNSKTVKLLVERSN